MTTFSVRTRGSRARYIDRDIPEPEVKNQRPIAAEEEHRVLQFRPRNSVRPPNWRGNKAPQAQRQDKSPKPLDLSRYERPREAPDGFRPRMPGNIARFAVPSALMGIGLWLVR